MDVESFGTRGAVGDAEPTSLGWRLLEQLRSLHVVWGPATLRKVTHAMAEMLSVHRPEAQVQQVLQWLKQAAKSKGPCRSTLSVGRDGVMIPMVKQNKYKEACTATVSVLDRCGRRIGTVYLGQMPEAHQVTLGADLTALLQEVLARWDGVLPRLVYVTDCGSHPTAYFEDVLSKMPNPRQPTQRLEWEWIVDDYHACQYITALADAIFGPGRALFAWSAKQRKILKEQSGGIYRVLRSAGALRTIRGMIGSEDDSEKAYRYLRSRTSKMDYRTYRHFRLPIGSGVTEAACKTVFTQRFKLSGMKWKLDGGGDILTLRIIVLSRVWPQARDRTLQTLSMPKAITHTAKNTEPAEKSHKMAA